MSFQHVLANKKKFDSARLTENDGVYIRIGFLVKMNEGLCLLSFKSKKP